MRRLAVILAGSLALVTGSAALAATTEVAVTDNAFNPNTSVVAVGDSVHWSRGSGSIRPHTVTANNGFWDTSCNPCAGPIDLTATLSAGTFHYYCKVHGSPSGSVSSGMNGLIKVPATVTAAPSGLPFTVTWATPSTTTGSRFDVQYRIGSTKWKTWRAATKSLKGVFGKNGKPTTVRHGATYSFRVRSRTADGPSRWSPPVAFTA